MFETAPSLMFAQQNLPPVTPSGDVSGPAPGTTTAPGGTNANPPAGQPGGGAGNPMLLIMVLVIAMLVFTVWSSRRDRKRREALISAVKKHDRVQTIGGVIGSVVEVKPDYIVLKVDESSNTRITFARSAVQQVLTSSAEDTSAKAE